MAPRQKAREPAHSLLGFWRFDPETRIAHADEAVCEAFGVPMEDGRAGTQLSQFEAKMHPKDREAFATSLRQAFESGATFSHSYRILDGHSRPRPVFALGRAFHGADGQSRYYVGALFEAGPDRSQGHARIDMINHLIAALDLARELNEDIMVRLVEAVLLEAGRRLAATIERMPDGTA